MAPFFETPWLQDDEVDALCAPLVQNAAKARYFKSLGLTVTRRPNGRPVVLRASWEAMQRGIDNVQVSAPQPRSPEPNVEGLLLQFSRNRAKA